MNANVDLVQVKTYLKSIETSLTRIKQTEKELNDRYRELGNIWHDSKYQYLGGIINNCNGALNKMRSQLEQVLGRLQIIIECVSEYEHVNLVGNGQGNRFFSSKLGNNLNGENDSLARAYNSDNPEIADKVREIVKDSFAEAKALSFSAREGKMNGRFFTDHKEKHVEMVAEKSLEAARAISSAVILASGCERTRSEGTIPFSSNIDNAVLEGAGLSHDTGMRGDGYTLIVSEDNTYSAVRTNNNNFDEIRKNHSLNSALNILINREKYIAAGYSNEQVDKMAAECMAHSKSSSGVTNLNSREQWSDCFNRIDVAVAAYNRDHVNGPITFNRGIFENDDEQLGALASETLALRIGDVSRDSYPGAEAQSGENVYVDISLLGRGNTWEAEIGNPNSVTIGEYHESVDSELSRRIHAGEQNISENHTVAGGDGEIFHRITIRDSSVAPLCTQEAINDHVGELATASEGQYVVEIDFESSWDEGAYNTYSTFAHNIMQILRTKGHRNISFSFPWDR